MECKRVKSRVVVRLDKGEEIVSSLLKICEQEEIELGDIVGIGAVNEFTVGLFDPNKKEYHSNTYKGYYEIVSLLGNIAMMDGKIYLHMHMSAADIENKVYGGHLNSAIISATCEIVIHVIDANVEREYNEEIGLNLFKF